LAKLQALSKLKTDLPFYAEQCLKIKAKSGQVIPLKFNRAQLYFHERLEDQKRRTGKVRALLLKGRQTGFSTYIGGRFYHATSLNQGVQTFILTHEQEATNNLFNMVERFHKHAPLKPSTGASNAKELRFDRLDSGYSVGTAGTKAVGRSGTTQRFHGSEVAFWPNAADHFAGIIQTVPDQPGTEIILESTANGVGGEYHERWQMAEAGVGDYEAVFIPWFWSEEYHRPAPSDFTLTEEEEAYAAAHGCTIPQMVWRRAKIEELKDPLLFKQEYPATAAEAFQLTGHDSYIKAEAVLAARKAKCEGIGPLIIGGDPARFGDDRFSLAWRRGRKVEKVESKLKLDTVAGANWIKQVIDTDNPARVFLDVGGCGAGVVDILHSWGNPYKKIVVPINFGGEPMEPVEYLKDGGKRPGPRNRRAEMWKRSKEWLSEPGGADIPDTDALQADACGPGYYYDVNQRLLLESKEKMRTRGVRSPDEWDAVALTFAEPVPAIDQVKKVVLVPMRGAQGWQGA
jgi:hypothetical protein